MKELRQQKLEKIPGIAETLDWAQALAALHIDALDKQVVEDTLGIILKDWKDIRATAQTLTQLFEQVGVVQKL